MGDLPLLCFIGLLGWRGCRSWGAGAYWMRKGLPSDAGDSGKLAKRLRRHTQERKWSSIALLEWGRRGLILLSFLYPPQPSKTFWFQGYFLSAAHVIQTQSSAMGRYRETLRGRRTEGVRGGSLNPWKVGR